MVSAIFILCTIGLMPSLFLSRHDLKEKVSGSSKNDELAILYQSGGLKAVKAKLARITFLHGSFGCGRDIGRFVFINLKIGRRSIKDEWTSTFKNLKIFGFNQRIDQDEESARDYGFDSSLFVFRMVGVCSRAQYGTKHDLLENYQTFSRLRPYPIVLLGMLAGSFLAYNNILNPVRHLTKTASKPSGKANYPLES